MVQKGWRKLAPSQVLVIGFAIVITMGAILLSLPIATENGQALPILDALFTSTSAVCVTGLVVVDTATTFSIFGECVIMCLIQFGGLGFMTFSVLFAIFLGRKIRMKERLILQVSFQQTSLQGGIRLTLIILAITIIVESMGILLLSFRWIPEWGWTKGLYYSLFHTVSAFNNAGFDLFGDYGKFSSLIRYVDDPLVSLTIAGLFILGGIGFIVIAELLEYRSGQRISLHTKLVLTVTVGLIVLGTLLISLIEWNNPKTIGLLSILDKFVASFFQNTTVRTAGYNTLNMVDMYPASQFILVLLMFVGAAPSSTGGGIKITTFMVVLLAVWSIIRGQKDVEIFQRRIPQNLIYRALTVLVVYLCLIILVTILLMITEHIDLTTSLFETVSAAATVGLSLGLTPELTPAGKILLVFTMFAGRLGPLTLAFAIAQREEKKNIRYPEEKPLIG